MVSSTIRQLRRGARRDSRQSRWVPKVKVRLHIASIKTKTDWQSTFKLPQQTHHNRYAKPSTRARPSSPIPSLQSTPNPRKRHSFSLQTRSQTMTVPRRQTLCFPTPSIGPSLVVSVVQSTFAIPKIRARENSALLLIPHTQNPPSTRAKMPMIAVRHLLCARKNTSRMLVVMLRHFPLQLQLNCWRHCEPLLHLLPVPQRLLHLSLEEKNISQFKESSRVHPAQQRQSKPQRHMALDTNASFRLPLRRGKWRLLLGRNEV